MIRQPNKLTSGSIRLGKDYAFDYDLFGIAPSDEFHLLFADIGFKLNKEGDHSPRGTIVIWFMGLLICDLSIYYIHHREEEDDTDS